MTHLRTCIASAPSSRGFTLIELLVVVGIMALMAVVSLPSLTGIQRQMAVTRAGNQFSDLAAKARQEALSRNVLSSLVILQNNGTQMGPAIVLLEQGSDGLWNPAGTWQILPNTVQLSDSASDTASLPGSTPPVLRFQGRSVNLADCDFLVFYPDARMRGTATGTSSVSRRIRFTQAAAGGKPTNYYDLLFNADTSAFQIVRP